MNLASSPATSIKLKIEKSMKIDKKKTINEESYGIITFKKLS